MTHIGEVLAEYFEERADAFARSATEPGPNRDQLLKGAAKMRELAKLARAARDERLNGETAGTPETAVMEGDQTCA